MRFLCVCLSPAIDATVRLDAWPSDGCIIKDAVDTFAPGGKVLDTTAAGDTLLAEWCFSGDPRRAVASGSAACTMPGGEPPSLSLVESLVEADGP